jgi:hypothetical protein
MTVSAGIVVGSASAAAERFDASVGQSFNIKRIETSWEDSTGLATPSATVTEFANDPMHLQCDNRLQPPNSRVRRETKAGDSPTRTSASTDIPGAIPFSNSGASSKTIFTGTR